MRNKPTLYIDQYGQKYFAKTIKELKQENYLSGKVSKMYVDDDEGNTYHVGYVIGKHWLRAYEPIRLQEYRTQKRKETR